MKDFTGPKTMLNTVAISSSGPTAHLSVLREPAGRADLVRRIGGARHASKGRGGKCRICGLATALRNVSPA